MTAPNLKVLFGEFNKTYFDNEIPEIPVVWNNKLRVTAGLCHIKWECRKKKVGRPTKISLANKLFAENDWNIEQVKNTLLHEMVHAYLVHKYNNSSHDRNFQNMMSKITGQNKNHRCHTYDVSSLRNKQDVEISCPVHGTVGHQSRIPRKGVAYVHRNCGEVLVYSKVNQNIYLGE